MTLTEQDTQNWLKISQDWQQSGLSQTEYCHSKGINRSYFKNSRTKLIAQGLVDRCYQKHKSEKPSMGFIPLHLATEDASAQITAPGLIEIALPHGIIMRIPTC